MSSFSEEKRLNRKKYRFVPRRVADPANKEKVSRTVMLPPETFQRIHKLACKEGISFSRALERMLDTDEAKAMAPDKVTSFIDHVKDTKLGYASYDIFTGSKRKTKTNGTTKGISSEVQGK